MSENPAIKPIRLQITEIYLSVQGEATWVGVPCTFIRLTGCPLRCTYCDSEYAFFGGKKMPLEDIVNQVKELGCPVVEVTGGEPLAQPNCIPLLQELIAQGFTVLLETSGSYTIENVPAEVHCIVDLKCPSSGESHRNLYENMDRLLPHHEVKFVIGSREDYDWAKEQVKQYDIASKCRSVLFSPVFGAIEPVDLVNWIVDDKLFEVRFQLQAHKIIWPPDMKGV